MRLPALLSLFVTACAAGTPSGPAHVQPSQSPIHRPPPLAPPPDSAATVESPSDWRAKLSQVPRGSDGAATLELTTDVPASSFLELIAAARATDFDEIDIARGNSAFRFLGPPPVKDASELLVTLRTDTFFVEISRPEPAPGQFRQSYVVEHVGHQLQTFLTTWREPPCELTVLATGDVPLFTIVDAVVGVSIARPCITGFSFGWSGGQREPRRAPRSGGRVLTLRVPVPPASAPPQATLHEKRDVRVERTAAASLEWSPAKVIVHRIDSYNRVFDVGRDLRVIAPPLSAGCPRRQLHRLPVNRRGWVWFRASHVKLSSPCLYRGTW
jgi:hypothetical protein